MTNNIICPYWGGIHDKSTAAGRRKYASGQRPNERKLAKPNTSGAKGRHATTHDTTINQKKRRPRNHIR